MKVNAENYTNGQKPLRSEANVKTKSDKNQKDTEKQASASETTQSDYDVKLSKESLNAAGRMDSGKSMNISDVADHTSISDMEAGALATQTRQMLTNAGQSITGISADQLMKIF